MASRRRGTGGTTASRGGVQSRSHAATVSRRLSRTCSRSLLTPGVALCPGLGHGLALAAEGERSLHLPTRIRLRRPYEPDDDAGNRQEQAGGETRFLAVALAGRQPGAHHRREQPAVEQVQRLRSDDCEYGHPPRYAFCTSEFSRRLWESSAT